MDQIKNACIYLSNYFVKKFQRILHKIHSKTKTTIQLTLIGFQCNHNMRVGQGVNEKKLSYQLKSWTLLQYF